MFKFKNAVIAFVIIFIQGFLALGAGLSATYLIKGNVVRQGVSVGSVDIGGLKPEAAEAKLDEYYSGIFTNGKLRISVKDTDFKFEKPYSELNPSFDSKGTIASIIGSSPAEKIRNNMRNYPGTAGTSVINPVIVFNEGLIRQMLMDISPLINKEAKDAKISIIDGKVIKTPETSGLQLNVSKTAEYIKNHITSNPEAEIVLSPYGTNPNGDNEITTTNPQIRLRDIDDIEQVIAKYSTDITDASAKEFITKAADAISGLIIPVYDGTGSDIDMEFSFINWLNTASLEIKDINTGYDQVASTLYAAILRAGIKNESITRLQHELPTDYIEPGLDALISPNGGDLKFKNTLTCNIAIFAEVDGDKLTIMIAGSLRDKKADADTELKVDVVQMIDPTVVNVESKEIEPGEKIVVNPGKKGMLVEVYRGDELIGTNKYEAVQEIVQVGPDSDWKNSDNK
ncbi:MAG: hypothetical protein HGA22_00280 [Clostridiales bacterium]|nr:hypothetical protein [Clostridiales bacterium]